MVDNKVSIVDEKLDSFENAMNDVEDKVDIVEGKLDLLRQALLNNTDLSGNHCKTRSGYFNMTTIWFGLYYNCNLTQPKIGVTRIFAMESSPPTSTHPP